MADELPLIEAEDIMAAMTEQVRLAFATDVGPEQLTRYMGVNPAALKEIALIAAQEEFEHAHGLGPLAVARIRGLSANQRSVVTVALTDTFEVAFRTGMVMANTRFIALAKIEAAKADGG